MSSMNQIMEILQNSVFQLFLIAWCSNENHVAVVYSHQYIKYLEEFHRLQTTNPKQDQVLFYFSCLGSGSNPGPFSTKSSVVPSKPSHIVKVCKKCAKSVQSLIYT